MDALTASKATSTSKLSCVSGISTIISRRNGETEKIVETIVAVVTDNGSKSQWGRYKENFLFVRGWLMNVEWEKGFLELTGPVRYSTVLVPGDL